jgi:eukaryotic-like serine/threonine-protein kinase
MNGTGTCLPVTPATSRSATDLLLRSGRVGPIGDEAGKTVETMIAPGGGGARRASAGRSIPGMAPEQRLLGRYRLIERLGSGGFGEVWRAHDELLNRQVALKRIEGGDGERAAREAKAAARLAHPAIVSLYEAVYEDGVCYLISELVEGDTLAVLIAEDALSDEQILAIGLALCDALEHAHARGVIHRDVKPHNVLIPDAPIDRAPAAKLTDFGGALLDGEQALTRTGDVLGTLAYMAPEQSDGRGAGPAADLYALALVLFEALSGENPIRAATPAATVRRIGSRLPPLRRFRRDLRRDVAAAVDRALLPAPQQRGTIAELAAAIDRCLDGQQEPPAHEFEQDLGEQTLAADELATAIEPLAALDVEATAVRDAPRRQPRLPAPTQDQPSESQGPLGRRAPRTAAAPVDEYAAEAARRASARGWLPLPRLLWLAAAVALVVAEVLAGRPGLALIVLAGALPLIVAMPRRAGPVWLLGALAPLFGLAGLAAAAPAFAGQPRSPRLRASLGALGFWWLSLAELALGRRMPPGAAFAKAAAAGAVRRVHYALPTLHAPASWEGSIADAAHALTALLSVSVLSCAALWALAALALPLIVRGRSVGADLCRALLWSGVLLLGPALLEGTLRTGAHVELSTSVGSGVPIAAAALGALLALGFVALKPAARAPRESPRDTAGAPPVAARRA